MLCACALQLKAQVIAGLDEIALMGDWVGSGNMGLIPALGGNRPKVITLKKLLFAFKQRL